MPYSNMYVTAAQLLSTSTEFTTGSIVYRRASNDIIDGVRCVWNKVPSKVMKLVSIRQGLHRRGTWAGNLIDRDHNLVQVDYEEGKLTFLHLGVIIDGVQYSVHEEAYNHIQEAHIHMQTNVYYTDQEINDEYLLAYFWNVMRKPAYRPGGY